MVTITRIFTRGGDKGKTSLGDGSRVSKHNPRIELIGQVDEVNAIMGLARLSVEGALDQSLEKIQQDLFDMGADLCKPEDPNPTAKRPLRIQPKHVKRLEKEIDHYNRELSPLTSFVLPGGNSASATLHFARTIVRRAERLVSAYLVTLSINPEILRYLNRLSDYLFVLARYMNDKGRTDILWEPGKNIQGKSETSA